MTGGGTKGLVVSEVYDEELKHTIQLNDIVISIDNKHLPPTTVVKDVSALIGSSKRQLLFRFTRAEANKTIQNRKKRDNKKKKEKKGIERRMKTIQKIKEIKINKKTTAKVTIQQEIESETDDKEYSTDDESMGSLAHIPQATGVNNSDTESILSDGRE